MIEPGRVFASLADSGERTHARLADLVGAEDGEAHVLEAARGLLGELGEGGRACRRSAARSRGRGSGSSTPRRCSRGGPPPRRRPRPARRGRGARRPNAPPSSSRFRRRRDRAPSRRRRRAPARPPATRSRARIQATVLPPTSPARRASRRPPCAGCRSHRPPPMPPAATRWAFSVFRVWRRVTRPRSPLSSPSSIRC